MTESFERHLAQGIACRRLLDYAGAIGHFLEACRLQPLAMGARCQLAHTYLQSGALDEAQAAFSGVPDSHPTHGDALAGLGHVARKRGDQASAATLFRRAVALRPNNAELRLELADELRELGQVEEARAEYRIVLTSHPDCWQALLALGLTARRLGEYATALAHFRSAITLQPGNTSLQCEVAFTTRLIGRLDEAHALYSSAMHADPSSALPLRGLGLVAEARGDLEAAIVFAKAVCDLDSHNTDDKLFLASLQRAVGNFGEASNIVDRVLASAPDNAGAWMERGLTERARNDHASALAAFQRAAELKRARGWIELAGEYVTIGQPRRAREIYQKVLARASADPDALLGLSLLQMAAAEFEACIQTCDTLIGLAPDRMESYLRKCMALLQLDRADEAVSIVVGLQPDAVSLPQADSVRLEILRTCGRRAEAQALLREPRVSGTRHFPLWLQSVLSRLAFFDLSGAEQALKDPPAVRHFEHARVHYLQATLAGLQWRVHDSIASLEKSLQIYAMDSAGRLSLVRLYLLLADVARASHHLELALAQNTSTLLQRGESTNTSQNLFGQLLNEFKLDRELLAHLAALREEEPQHRVEPLLALVRANAGFTPPAMHLMLALRESGALEADGPPNEGGESPIPPKILQFWDQARPPDAIAKLLCTWKDAHPGFQYRCFDRESARAYIADNHSKEVLDAFRSAVHPAQACDLFRLAYLYLEGGYYADADDRCVGHLSAVRAGGARLVAYQEQFASLGNNFLGCVPGEPVIGRALALAVEALTRGDSDCIWLATGPGLMTRAFAQVMAEQGPDWRNSLQGYRILDRKELVDVSWAHSVLSYKNTPQSWLRRHDPRRGGPQNRKLTAE